MPFDANAALQSGATEDQVLDYLTKTRSYDVAGATKAGASKRQIIDYLSTTSAPKKKTGVGEVVKNIDTATAKVFEPVSNVLFGTTGKIVGGLLGSAAEQIQGKDGVFTQNLGKELATPGSAAKNIGLTALELLPGGGALEKAGGKFLGKLAPGLKASAIEQYSKALAPTTREMKALTSKVVPELLQRGETALTRKGLAAKAEAGLATAGEKLNVQLEKIPAKTRVAAGPVLKALNDSRKQFIVPGTKVVADPKAVQAIDQVQEVVKSLGNKVSFESMRGLRQIWDKSVAKSKGFLLDEVSNFSVMAKKEGSNAIRRELARKFPDLAKVNAEYSFWKNVDDVISATVQRTAGQASPLGEKIATAAGAAGGLARGTGGDAVQAALAFRWLSQAFNSTAWRTFSAVQKNKLADSLIQGKFNNVLTMLSKFVSPTVRSQEQQ